MATRQEVEKKFQELGVNRKVSDEDVANANKYGMELFDKTFASNDGVPTNTSAPPQTSGQAGQEANQTAGEIQSETGVPDLATLRKQEAEALKEEAEVGSQKAIQTDYLQRLLAARQREAPYQELIAKKREQLGKININDYKGMAVDDMINAMSSDIARVDSQKRLLQDKLVSLDTSANDTLNSFVDMMNMRLQAAGLRVDRIGNMVSRGIQEEQFAQQMARRGGGGGGTSRENKFASDVQDAILALDTGKLEWGTAWDILKAGYPEKSNEDIDAALGGSYGEGGPTGRAANTYGTSAGEGEVYSQLQQDVNAGMPYQDALVTYYDVPPSVLDRFYPEDKNDEFNNLWNDN